MYVSGRKSSWSLALLLVQKSLLLQVDSNGNATFALCLPCQALRGAAASKLKLRRAVHHRADRSRIAGSVSLFCSLGLERFE